MSLDQYMMPDRLIAPLISKSDLERVCLHAVDCGAHEIQITGGEPPLIVVGKAQWPLSERPIGPDEVKELVRAAFGDRRYQEVLGGEPQDCSFVVRRGRDQSDRFRVNISSGYRLGESISLGMRRIPNDIPAAEALGLPPDLVDYCTELQRGAIIFAGATGTGKSTSMAALIKHRLMHGGRCERFYSAEAPIEFVHDYKPPNPSTMLQAEVGKDIKSFAAGVRNILRRNTTLFLVGETRDAETTEALLRGASVGPLTYTTCHATNVPTIIPRLFGEFERAARDAAISLIVGGTRLYVAQTLLNKKGGGMVACREYLKVTSAEVADALETKTQENAKTRMKEILAEYGVSMPSSAEDLFNQGLIEQEELDHVRREYGAI